MALFVFVFLTVYPEETVFFQSPSWARFVDDGSEEMMLF